MGKRKTTATSRAGVNYTRSIVEEANSSFQPLEHDNDFGIDALIELVEGEDLRGVMVGVQIKSGASYCTSTTCTVPITPKHRSYWTQYPLPVVGIVYDPKERLAYWADISGHLKRNRKSPPASIRFEKNLLSRFDLEGFRTFFLPTYLRRPVVLALEQSIDFASAEGEAHRVGIRSLFHGHIDDPRAWETFLHLFHTRPANSLDRMLIYILAHVPGHGDIAWPQGSFVASQLRAQLREKMVKFGRKDIEKLLSFVAEGFGRGTIGQSADAIVSMVPEGNKILRTIATDPSVSLTVRGNAVLLVAFYEQRRASRFLHAIREQEPRLARIVESLLEPLRRFGFISFY